MKLQLNPVTGELDLVGGGGAVTLAQITDMSADARTFNAAANKAAQNLLLWEYKDSNFTAVPGGRYVAAQLTVTSPAGGTVGDTFEVLVVGGAVTIGGVAFGSSRFPVNVMCLGAGTWYVEPANVSHQNLQVGPYQETEVGIGTVTSAHTLSLAAGTFQTATLTASTACTFTMPTATAGKSFTLLLKQAAATGLGTAVFTDVKWETATAPTMTSTAGKMDIFSFVSDGTNWYGSVTQGYTP